jgi:PPOX class probable F420-dependent enzyme
MLSAEQGLSRINELGARDNFLAVVVTIQPSGEPSTSVVNAGVVPHPLTGEPTVALVSRGGTAKLANLRQNPTAALVFRAGWEWIGVHGPAEVVGPDDPMAGLDAERLRILLRDVYHAAGGVHDNLEEYDRAMVQERRAVVLIRPSRFTSNPQ